MELGLVYMYMYNDWTYEYIVYMNNIIKVIPTAELLDVPV